MKFELTNFKPMDRNTLRGFVSLIAGPFLIEGFTLHVQGDKAWIGFPSKEYLDKETGEKRYHPMLRIEDKDRYYKFQDWATAEARKLMGSVPEKTKAEDKPPF